MFTLRIAIMFPLDPRASASLRLWRDLHGDVREREMFTGSSFIRRNRGRWDSGLSGTSWNASQAHHSVSGRDRAGRVVKGRELCETCATRATRWNWLNAYNHDGADELVFLDITASSDAREIMAGCSGAHGAKKVFIPLAVGGGNS